MIDRARSSWPALALAASLSAACHGSSSTASTPAGVSVTVSPHAVSLADGATQGFSASVTGTSNTAVTWTVEPAGCGSVNGTGAAITYTAPSVATTCKVRATSVADASRSDAATVTVVSGVAVTVSPHTVALSPSTTQAFTATVTGTSNGAVTWSLDASGCGTVTPTSAAAASYVAPPNAATCKVRARSVAETTATDAATVTVVTGTGGTAYHVGEGEPYTSIGDVPWYALLAGDTVYIHYRPNAGPYHEKFLVSGQGTATAWIRVLGVPGPNGELPVISGDNATTSTNMHYRWPAASGSSSIQWDGVVQIASRSGTGDGGLPSYVEIAGLQVQKGYSTYQFTAENGVTANYENFAACIYARSVKHLIVRDNVLTDCGQGFYDWNGDGAAGGNTWWDGTTEDLVLRGNYFYGNGAVGDFSMHQVYSEALGTVIDGNRFGPMRTGALGSQIKDRSAGTVIRYNFVQESPEGWILDLVEPENPCGPFAASPMYRQDFVYGNVLRIRASATNQHDNLIHWNEDHQGTTTCPGQPAQSYGRSVPSTGRLSFYDNTLAVFANDADFYDPYHLVNETWGAFECAPFAQNGRIVARNNVFAMMPRTTGAPEKLRFGYCGQERIDLGTNWIPAGAWASGGTAELTGQANLVSSGSIGFLDPANDDFRLGASSAAAGIGTALDPIPLTGNALGLDLTPNRQYVFPHADPTPLTTARAQSGAGSDLGAFER